MCVGCSGLQGVAVCRRVDEPSRAIATAKAHTYEMTLVGPCHALQWVTAWCSVVQCGAVCCSVLQSVAVCCIVLQCVARIYQVPMIEALHTTLQRKHVDCFTFVLQNVADCCSVLQRVAACCNVLHFA